LKISGLDQKKEFKPVFFILLFIGMVILASVGFTMPMGAVLLLGSVLVVGWAGYATYGTIGVAVTILAYVLILAIYSLVRR
jgi:hypothetical membrane protein